MNLALFSICRAINPALDTIPGWTNIIFSCSVSSRCSCNHLNEMSPNLELLKKKNKTSSTYLYHECNIKIYNKVSPNIETYTIHSQFFFAEITSFVSIVKRKVWNFILKTLIEKSTLGASLPSNIAEIVLENSCTSLGFSYLIFFRDACIFFILFFLFSTF